MHYKTTVLYSNAHDHRDWWMNETLKEDSNLPINQSINQSIHTLMNEPNGWACECLFEMDVYMNESVNAWTGWEMNAWPKGMLVNVCLNWIHERCSK